MPRSASRDLADRFAGPGGTRVRYFQKFNRYELWKIWLSRLAVAVVLVWGALLFFTKQADSQVTHGTVANVHAPWNDKCEACHRDTPGANFLDARGRWRTFSCEKCHAAPVHHANIRPGDASEDCSSCHHDHNGSNFSLLHLSDNHCVRCHGNLADVAVQKAPFVNEVTNFATQHPPFKSLDQSRPSTLKFSHAQHMTPGMVLADGAKGGYMKDGKLAQLKCQDCHTLDVAGRYYQPINYEKNCKQCHPTQVQPQVTAWDTVVKEFDVPHGLQPTAVHEVLTGAYSRLLQKDHAALTEALRKPSADPKVAAFTAQVAAATSASFDSLMKVGCAKCHTVPVDASAGIGPGAFRIEPTKIPTVWMTHAKFDHAAHRAMDCKDCHPGTAAGPRTTEREPLHFVAETKAFCVTCHAPGKVTSACTDCHSYHHGDSPRIGDKFAPKTTLDIQQLLRGH